MAIATSVHTETTWLAIPEFTLVEIAGSTYHMGGDRYDKEKPIHKVTLENFAIGKYPVTQAVWKAVMAGTDREDPAYFKHPLRPVEQVSWDDVLLFLQRLNALPEVKAQNEQENRQFRLPSEAQWEFAARGGKLSQGFEYAGSNKLKEVGWYTLNSHGETQPVGLKMPNELGLHDMSGNVWEWCADTWHDNYEGAPTDGSVWIDGGGKARRVVRGGAWNIKDFNCRCAHRYWEYVGRRNINFGFRLARY